MSTLASDPIPLTHARSAWAAGVEPLRDAFPTHADRLIRAIAFSHVASLPVPILVRGSATSGRSELVDALAELAGETARTNIEPMTLAGIRRAAVSGEPLVVDAANGWAMKASMFDEIETESYAAFSTRLHLPSALIAAGSQPIHPLSASRVIAVELPLRPRSVQPIRAASSEPARAGRRIVASYLQGRAPHVELDSAALTIVRTRDLDNSRRLGAALYLGDQILRALNLEEQAAASTSWLNPDDQIVWALRDAIRYLLANGGELTDNAASSKEWVIGRAKGDHLLIRPAEALPFIRAAHGDSTLTSKDVAAALRRARLLTTATGTIVARIANEPTRVWKISDSLGL